MATRERAGGGAGAPAEARAAPRPADRPALVLGGGLTALGVTRCLARRRVRVLHLTAEPGLVARSRWYAPAAGEPAAGVEEDPGSLARALSAHVPPSTVLFPCSDAAVVAVASLPGEVRARYPAAAPPADAVDRLVDKARLAEAAEAADVPHPPTALLRSEDDLAELESEWFRHALLKPRDSLRFFRAFGRKGIPVTSRSEAREAYRRYFQGGATGAVLQRYVEGPSDAHLFLDGYRSRAGTTKGLLARRRERMYPPTTGNSSCMVTVPREEAAAAAEALERLLDRTAYHGIFSAEFKEDGHGVPRLLEVNVRPWWYVEFAARCGVDVCDMAYREACGEEVGEAPPYPEGRRCVYAYYDLHAGWEEVRAGRLGLLAWLRQWLGSDRPVFARDDPAPALAAAWRRARGVAGRRLGRGGDGGRG